jgi:cobalt-zinc-cadmium efflux system membrane fusion protein
MIRTALVGLLALAACGRRGSDDEDAAPPAVVSVGTAVAGRGVFQETVDATGEVAARPGSVADLGAPGPTRVTRVMVAVGQRVRAGQPLVTFDQTAFAAEARTAAAALASAEHAYERAKRLSDAGIVPRKEAVQAAADLAAARGSAQVARHTEALATLRSPISGVVTRMDAVLGASVDAGTPLVEVADASALDVQFTLSPADAARVRPGSVVSLLEGPTAGGATIGTGMVADVGAAVDSVSHGVPVRVRVTAPSRPLRIGETVTGHITAGERSDAVTVPVAALVPAGDDVTVFVVDSAGIAHARRVTVGGRSATAAEIRSGLAAGERVVTDGAYGVQDSARVRAAAR